MSDPVTITLTAAQLAIAEQAISIYAEQLAQLLRESTYSGIVNERRVTALAVQQILRRASR